MRQLQISYFVQCIDLTNAFNGNVVCDEKRSDYRDIVTHFIDSFPDAPLLNSLSLWEMKQSALER